MSEPVGSLTDEALKLLAAAEEWWRERVAPAVGDLGAHEGPECQICPLCQLLAVLRGSRPEVFEHLTEAVVAMLLAAKAALDAQERVWARRRSAPVQRIDIG